jgi:hypothetical protein
VRPPPAQRPAPWGRCPWDVFSPGGNKACCAANAVKLAAAAAAGDRFSQAGGAARAAVRPCGARADGARGFNVETSHNVETPHGNFSASQHVLFPRDEKFPRYPPSRRGQPRRTGRMAPGSTTLPTAFTPPRRRPGATYARRPPVLTQRRGWPVTRPRPGRRQWRPRPPVSRPRRHLGSLAVTLGDIFVTAHQTFLVGSL